MTDTNTPCESELIWQRNLAAIRSVDAGLADRLSAVAPPPEAAAATGRDGSRTFKIRTPDGDRWLGHTSMPTVSGPALLSNFDPGEGNVVLAGIGQGIEARLLTEGLGPNRAVFVLERDPGILALALRVHDLSGPLARGRLVLIVGDDLGAALVGFLGDHDGYLAPERMLSWPWLDPSSMDEMRLAVQRSAAEVARRRAAALAAVVGGLNETYADSQPLPDRPGTLVICPHAGQEACRFAADVLTGLAELEWPAASWLGDSPDRGHPLALARRLAEFGPDMVILIDAVRAGLTQVLPATIPVACWLTGGARLGSSALDRIGPDDRIFATNGRVIADLVDAGLEPPRVRWLGPSVTTLPAAGSGRHPSFECDVVAIADALPLGAEANGLALESHQAAWKIIRGLIGEQAERYTSDQAERLLAQAESATGARFGEPSFRRQFCDRINAVLGQTLVRRAVLEAVRRAGVTLCLWGRGWQDHASLAPVCRGVASAEDRETIYASAKVVLHVDVTGNVTSEVLRAAGAGAVVLARAHPSDQDANGLAQLLRPGRELLTFKRHSELIGHLKRLLNDEPAREAMARRARDRLAEQHTMGHRLRTLRSAMVQAGRDPQTG